MSNGQLFKRLRESALQWALPAALLIAWETAARLGWLSPRLLPAPSAVAVAFWENLLDGSLATNTLISCERAFKGLASAGIRRRNVSPLLSQHVSSLRRID